MQLDLFNLMAIDSAGEIILVFTVAFYLVECYMGYKILKWLIPIVGFIVGFAVGFIVSSFIYTKDAYVPAMIGMIAGIVLALVSYRLYLAGVFIFCGTVALRTVTQLSFGEEGAMSVLKLILCIAAFIIVGILGVKFARLCIIAVTSITGAINAVGLLATPIAVLGTDIVTKVIVIIMIAATGMIVQRMTTQ